MDLIRLRDKIKSNKIGYLFLYFFSLFYLFLFRVNKFFNEKFRQKKFPVPIVCIGNISCGGTGKTSFVISLSKKLTKLKINHAINMRGYKSKYTNKITDSMMENVLDDENSSDEQKLIVLSTKNKVPVVASYKRVEAIKYIISKHRPSLIIMDDGFQNFKIHKDLNIVLINLNSFYDKILPLGNLRESYKGLKRSDFVVLNHCELFDEEKIEKIASEISRFVNKEKIIKAKYILKGFINMIDGSFVELKKFRKKEVSAFCAIGDNIQFKNFLEKNGFIVSKFWYFSDHHRYTITDLVSIKNLSAKIPILTTYKDAVKFLKNAKKIFDEIYAVDIEMEYSDDKIIEKIKKLI
jgi:tetraacyldisaccharide 4'-kinase